MIIADRSLSQGDAEVLDFECDAGKSAANVRKHRFSFEEAESAFEDLNCLRGYDLKHAEFEERWLLLGCTSRHRLLAVSYTRRSEKIRIISAPRANQAEKCRYTDEA